MARVCTICTHTQRAEIEAGIVASTSYRNIAKQFSVSIAAIARHKENCLKPAVQVVQVEQQGQAGWNAVSEMEWMHKEAHSIYEEVRKGDEKDYRLALQSLAEIRKQTELFSELLGDAGQTQAEREQEWINLREIIFSALEPFPDARLAVARALLALEKSDGSSNTGGQLG